jgi:DNA-directed RNA polymerase subunit M/transcription elongation factor TFIIS
MLLLVKVKKTVIGYLILDLKLLVIKELIIEIERIAHDLLYKPEDKGSKYYSRVKAIISNTKNNTELKERILDRDVTPKDLVTMDVKEMASTDIQDKRKKAEEDGFKSRRSDWNSVHSTQTVGMYSCEECKGERTSSFQLQIRGADEPMTT